MVRLIRGLFAIGLDCICGLWNRFCVCDGVLSSAFSDAVMPKRYIDEYVTAPEMRPSSVSTNRPPILNQSDAMRTSDERLLQLDSIIELRGKSEEATDSLQAHGIYYVVVAMTGFRDYPIVRVRSCKTGNTGLLGLNGDKDYDIVAVRGRMKRGNKTGRGNLTMEQTRSMIKLLESLKCTQPANAS